MALVTRGVALALAGLAVAGTSQAQTEVDIGVMGGWTMPTQDAADLYVAGYNIGGQLRWMPGTSPIGLQIEGAYHHLNRDALNAQDLGFNMLQASANAVWPIQLEASPLMPYLIGGVGVMQLKVKNPRTVNPYQKSTKVAINLGAGLEFRWTSSFAPFADFRLIGIVGSDQRETAYVTLDLGAKLIFGGPQAKAKRRR